jgi:hypothetical protein
MVKLTIIIEGGAREPDPAVAVADNTQSLRQSLHRIFSGVLRDEVDITIYPEGGYRNAAFQFVNSIEINICLFVDLEDTKDKIPCWFARIATENPNKPIIIADTKKVRVFFMVQEMEAWLLKQPEALEAWGKKNGYTCSDHSRIADHALIAGKNIEEIRKPSEKLGDILKHFFTNPSSGKKIRYGKLKTAPALLDCLDIDRLKNNDSEIQRFSVSW